LEFLAAQSLKNNDWYNEPAIENCLLRCGTAIFCNYPQKTICCRQLRESLGAIAYKHLIALLSYIQLCHQWLEGNPDVSYEHDRRAQLHLAPLLLEEIALAEVFQNDRVATTSVDTIALPTAKNPLKDNIYWERFQRCFVESPFPMAIWDREGKIVRVNQNWIDITGYSSAELSTLEEWTNKAQVQQQDIVPSHQLGWEAEIDFQQVVNVLLNLPYRAQVLDCQPTIANATCSEVTIVTRNGEQRFWDLYSASLNSIDLGIELTLSIAKDVTNFILQKTELKENVTKKQSFTDPIKSQTINYNRQSEVTQSLDEDELARILHLIPYHLLVVNIDTERITFCNRELAVCLGFSDARQVCGKTILQCFSPENAQRITQQYRQVLRSGKILRVQESIVLRDGKHYFDTTITPLKNSSGRLYALLHTCSELPDLVATTQEALSQRTAQLEAANKELESFSYSVSHDLQAPLRVINGFSQVIWDNYHELLDDRAKHYLQRIQANSERMSESIDALLQLSRVTRIQMHLGYVNLSEMVKEIANELIANHPQRKVKFKIANEIRVKGDPMLLRIMLNNLLDNSWKYTSKTEFAYIEFGSISDTNSEGLWGESNSQGADSGGFLLSLNAPPPCTPRQFTYFVRDNGAGFNPQYAAKLFKAFQRLHSDEEFPGMGIGLATVQRIIYRHGGKIWATGQCDRGASFYFSL
jgi:signal transduction histidine kinase